MLVSVMQLRQDLAVVEVNLEWRLIVGKNVYEGALGSEKSLKNNLKRIKN